VTFRGDNQQQRAFFISYDCRTPNTIQLIAQKPAPSTASFWRGVSTAGYLTSKSINRSPRPITCEGQSPIQHDEGGGKEPAGEEKNLETKTDTVTCASKAKAGREERSSTASRANLADEGLNRCRWLDGSSGRRSGGRRDAEWRGDGGRGPRGRRRRRHDGHALALDHLHVSGPEEARRSGGSDGGPRETELRGGFHTRRRDRTADRTMSVMAIERRRPSNVGFTRTKQATGEAHASPIRDRVGMEGTNNVARLCWVFWSWRESA